MQSLIDLLGLEDFIPHGYCLSWSPVLLWLNVISDLLITLAYYSIPLILVYFLRRRKDLPYPWLLAMFAGFIVACGTTHLLSAITVWIPLYWLDGLVKGLTAVLSIATAMLMLWIVPKVLFLPSAAQLQAEIQQRKTAEEALRVANDELQKNIARTELLFDSALDGIITMDHSGNVIGWNAQAESIFGYSCEQALGRKIAELIVPPAYRESHRQGLARFIETGASNIIGMRLEVAGMRADASEFPMELAVEALGEKDDYFFSAYVRDISERKQAEATQRDALDKLQKIAAQLPGVVFQFRLRGDGSFCLPYASDVLRDIYRLDPEDVLDDAAKLFAVVHPDDLEQHLASIKVSTHDLSPWRNEYRLRFADDTERWLFGNALPQREEDGSVLWHGFVSDITERKKAEETARAASQYARSLIEASLDPLVTISATGKITDVNSATEQVTGVNRDNLIGSDFTDYFTDPDKARDGYLQVFSQGFVNDYPLAIRHTSGNVTEVLYNASVYRDENDDILGVFAAARDITERKLMEDELKASETKFRSIIEVSPVPMALNDEQLNITFLNQAFVQTFGYRVDDIPTLADWWPKAYPDPNYRHWVAETWQAALENAEREHQPFRPMELNIRSKDGVVKTVLASAAMIADSFKDEHLVVLYDITERKQAELAKRHSEAQLQAFYELDLVGLTITSLDKGWIRINDCLCKMLEYSEQDLRQMNWAELTHPDDLAADVEQFEKLLANEIDGYALEKRFISRTGKIIPTKLVVRSIRKTNGELDYVVAMVEDITEYKQAEAELKRSNAELEQFAYAVSHDMRQPLRMVNSYLSLIESALAGQLNEETQQFLHFAGDGAKRMDAMILSLLDYSRVGRKTEAKTRISSKASLDEALAFLGPEIGACGGEIKVTGDWPELFASRDELTRLLQNLIGNALKYHEENQPPQVHIHGMTKADSLRVEVRDQGIGIAPTQIERLFKVFSRLQARSRFDGTGVGLALCRKIVEHHGGIIGAESAGEGRGCVFWFELPMVNTVNAE
jgi:PAS domain S-box-containing protein